MAIIKLFFITLLLAPAYLFGENGGIRYPTTSLEQALEQQSQGMEVTELRISDYTGCRPIGGYHFDEPERIYAYIDSRISLLQDLKLLHILECNDRSELPEELGELGKLEELILQRNYYKKIPDSIGKLTNLRKLDLSYNNVSKIPESIGRLMNLEKLILIDNQIEYLPEGIINLVNMQYLEGARNKFNINHVQLYYSRKDSTYKQGWESKYGQTIYKSIFKKSPFIPEAYIVTATSGLSVREKPNLKAKKIGTMPYQLRIAVYEESKNTETIDGITAPWMRIKAVANNKYMEGWTWGGYLEKFVYTE